MNYNMRIGMMFKKISCLSLVTLIVTLIIAAPSFAIDCTSSQKAIDRCEKKAFKLNASIDKACQRALDDKAEIPAEQAERDSDIADVNSKLQTSITREYDRANLSQKRSDDRLIQLGFDEADAIAECSGFGGLGGLFGLSSNSSANKQASACRKVVRLGIRIKKEENKKNAINDRRDTKIARLNASASKRISRYNSSFDRFVTRVQSSIRRAKSKIARLAKRVRSYNGTPQSCLL